MGVYVYTARKESRSVHAAYLTGTVKVAARIVRIADRLSEWSGGCLPRAQQAKWEARRNRREARAREAVESSPSKLFIIDFGDGLEGAPVVKAPDDWTGVWYDCDKFPGDLVGVISKRNRARMVTSTSKWGLPYITSQAARAGGAWLLVEARSVCKNGRLFEERRAAHVDRSTPVGSRIVVSARTTGYLAGWTPDGYAVICPTRNEDDFAAAMNCTALRAD